MTVRRRPGRRAVLLAALVAIGSACSPTTGPAEEVGGGGAEATSPSPTWVGQARSHEVPKVRVLQPADGSIVDETFRVHVVFEGILPAAAGRVRHGEGHWNILVDRPCVSAGDRIPVDEAGVEPVSNGALVSELSLEPGVHKLCVQVADGYHIATNIRDFVTVTVGQDGMVPPEL